MSPILLVAFSFVTLASASCEDSAAKNLDVKADAPKRMEVNHGQIGPRSTMIFYIFNEMKAVVKVVVGNKSTDFPISATVYEFDGGVTDEGLKRWLNNQHSDGLYPEVPEPVATHTVPGESCKVKEHKLLERGIKSPIGGEFVKHSVSFEIAGVAALGKLKLNDFSDECSVFVKSE